jgi:hypothetical protein
MAKRLLAWGLLIGLGLFLLNALYGMLVTATMLNDYEKTFQNLQHPQDTKAMDTFKIKFSYYPATYRDESIQNRCAYLIGEIRTYANDWDVLKTFYSSKTLVHGNGEEIYVGILPIDFVSNGKLSSSINTNNHFSYSPFDVDILQELRSRYMFWGLPEGVIGNENQIYVVYIAPKCE